MKSKVIDIMSKKDFSEQVRNTRVHSFSVKPEYFEEEAKLKQFFENYAKWYKCDISTPSSSISKLYSTARSP